jgi:hypothetical protein
MVLGFSRLLPDSIALFITLFTFSLLSADNATITSVFFEVSQISFLVKVLKIFQPRA